MNTQQTGSPFSQPEIPGTVRIALITDTHTTRGVQNEQPLYKARFEQVIATVNERRPAWVLHGGDLTEDAAAEEIEDFKAQSAAIKAPLDWVYGNHDVGSKLLEASQDGITGERLARMETALGPAFWEKKHAGLRVIGLCASLINSGLPREAEQWAFLENALAAPSPEPTILLTHYPPFFRSADEPEDPYWNLAPEPRARLLQLAKQGGVKAILAGHLHYPLNLQFEGVPLIVSPPVSFGLPPETQPEGWTEITIAKDGVSAELLYL